MSCNFFHRASLTAAALAAHPHHSVTLLTFLSFLTPIPRFAVHFPHLRIDDNRPDRAGPSEGVLIPAGGSQQEPPLLLNYSQCRSYALRLPRPHFSSPPPRFAVPFSGARPVPSSSARQRKAVWSWVGASAAPSTACLALPLQIEPAGAGLRFGLITMSWQDLLGEVSHCELYSIASAIDNIYLPLIFYCIIHSLLTSVNS